MAPRTVKAFQAAFSSLLLLILAVQGALAQDPEREVPWQPAGGPPVAFGRSVAGLALGIVVDAREITLGPAAEVDPFSVSAFLKNVGSQPLRLDLFLTERRLFEFALTAPDGDPVEGEVMIFEKGLVEPRPEAFGTLLPGASTRVLFRFPYLSGRSFAGRLGRPGVYRLRASYVAEGSPLPEGDRRSDLWQGAWVGEVTSNEIEIRVSS